VLGNLRLLEAFHVSGVVTKLGLIGPKRVEEFF
jgi:hypothetical protein